MKDLKKMKGLALVLTGLTLAGLVMTADAADMAGKMELCIRFLRHHGKERSILK